MNRTPPVSNSMRSPVTPAVIFGLTVFVLLILTDQVSIHFGLKESQRIADDTCGGIIAGLVVFWFERARSRSLRERWQIIALMNHHVRNALQVIAYSANVPPDPQKISQIQDAVSRIEWALREVLPGEVVDFDKHWRQTSANAPDGSSKGA